MMKNSGVDLGKTQRQRRWLFAAVAAVAGLGGAGLAWRKFSPGPVDEAELAALWGLEFETPAGARLSMSALRGRPLLINFWATWCPPCVEELPLLDVFYKENKANGFQVLGLAVDRLVPVQDFLARQPLAFPVALAGMSGIALSKALGNAGGGLPFSVLIGAEGAVRARKIGKLSAQELARWRELK